MIYPLCVIPGTTKNYAITRIINPHNPLFNRQNDAVLIEFDAANSSILRAGMPLGFFQHAKLITNDQLWFSQVQTAI